MSYRKYNNKTVEIDGIKFDSKVEAERYAMLKILQRAGEIKDLVVHPRYKLQDGFSYQSWKEFPLYYEADFQYRLGANLIIEDVKGFKTTVYRIKRKLFLSMLAKGFVYEGQMTYPIFEEVKL